MYDVYVRLYSCILNFPNVKVRKVKIKCFIQCHYHKESATLWNALKSSFDFPPS